MKAEENQPGERLRLGILHYAFVLASDFSARVRPRVRSWLPYASVHPEIFQQNIKVAGALGAGEIELLPFYAYGSEVPGADWTTYGFGTPSYLKMFKAALQAHKEEAGLAMDFHLGPDQGQGVPEKYDDVGLQWDLSYTRAPSICTADVPSSIIGYNHSSAGDLHLHVASNGGANATLPLSNGKIIAQLRNRNIASTITLANWTLNLEIRDYPVNLGDASLNLRRALDGMDSSGGYVQRLWWIA
ncbi:uncharacterized protein BP01DRAFT_387746 [Aspergillus saccharolyticus JOP 1030-1]|uniref:Uncharacterized protein n=1 Tax=Aspergillus saccharolyticus JOP 1030-1 TaxID=1450539 RepID=A0A318ZSF4_9EURO|nr:hypothetical protein BP01DRAFT_387746 [Aspergillus saccharolyticus JOP 1030-1]PYH49574.1 hypothetical protein BP01DRAFT_387746 [Aspergillus saccharolyticus JOP 1030-1]